MVTELARHGVDPLDGFAENKIRAAYATRNKKYQEPIRRKSRLLQALKISIVSNSSCFTNAFAAFTKIMMQNIWRRLGLKGPTDDLKVIKKAYAAKLRETRPADDPDGFMKLREAFDSAKNYARFASPQVVDEKQKFAVENIVVNIPDKLDDNPQNEETIEEPAKDLIDENVTNETRELKDIEHLESDLNPQDTEAVEEQLKAQVEKQFDFKETENTNGLFDELMHKLAQLKEDKALFKKFANWQPVIAKGATLSLDDYSGFEDVLRQTMLEITGYYTPTHRFKAELADFFHYNPKPIPAQTTRKIFEAMNWKISHAKNRVVQEELTYICERSGILKRPKLKAGSQEWISDLKKLARYILMFLALMAMSAILRIGIPAPDPAAPPPKISIFSETETPETKETADAEIKSETEEVSDVNEIEDPVPEFTTLTTLLFVILLIEIIVFFRAFLFIVASAFKYLPRIPVFLINLIRQRLQ